MNDIAPPLSAYWAHCDYYGLCKRLRNMSTRGSFNNILESLQDHSLAFKIALVLDLEDDDLRRSRCSLLDQGKRLRKNQINLKELASNLGLSQSTVSRALRSHPAIPEPTRKRVLFAAERAGYRPNARARSLAIGRTEAIALVFPLERLQLPETNFVDVLAGISTVVTARNYALLMVPFKDDEPAALRKLASSKAVDGVIITRPVVHDPRVAMLNDLEMPFVLHGRTETEQPYSFADTDNESIFRRLTSLLIDYGHRRIVAINGLAHFRYAAARAAGFRSAFAERGLECAQDAVEFVSMTEETGYKTAARRLADKEPPTAFVCGSVFQARGVYRAAAEHGLVIGRDLSVVAHDDGARSSNPSELSPSLSTTYTPVSSVGAALAHILIDRIEAGISDPVGNILPFELILRDSVGLIEDRQAAREQSVKAAALKQPSGRGSPSNARKSVES